MRLLCWKQATQLDNPLRQASARVDVFVVDVNDNRPEFEYDMYNITVMENLPQGFTVLQVYAFDADKGENAEFRYVLEDPSQAFRIDEKNGWISVRDPTKLDRETQSRIQMKVTAQEKRPHANSSTSFTTVEINLLDANDNNPQVRGRRTNRRTDQGEGCLAGGWLAGGWGWMWMWIRITGREAAGLFSCSRNSH